MSIDKLVREQLQKEAPFKAGIVNTSEIPQMRETQWGTEHLMRREEAIKTVKKFEGADIRKMHWTDLVNCASACDVLGLDKKAVEIAQMAVHLKRNSITLYNLAVFLERQGRFAESFPLAEEAALSDEKNQFANLLYAEDLLRAGRWQEGWPRYNKHLIGQLGQFMPEWDGVDHLANKRIFVELGGGYGDIIMYFRWVQELKRRGAYVLFSYPIEMQELFEDHPWIDRLVPIKNKPEEATEPDLLFSDFDTWISLVSLPRVLCATVEALNSEPYLKARPLPFAVGSAPTIFKSSMGTLGIYSSAIPAKRPRIGFCSMAGELSEERRERSMTDEQAAQILAIPEIDWVNLTYRKNPAIKTWGDTARLIDACDLVVTVDTGVAHLAGAMGKKVWVIVQGRSAVVYLLDREDSPFYSNMKIFRNPGAGMQDSINRVTEELKKISMSVDVQDVPCDIGG